MIKDTMKTLSDEKAILLYDYNNRERETDLVAAAELGAFCG